MDKEKIDSYSFKVTQASRTQLVVLVYDIILDDLAEARKSYASGDVDGFVANVKHGQKFVAELMATLDCKYQISLDLMTLYIYVNKQMIAASIQKTPDALERIEDVIHKLRNAFYTISKTDNSGPVMNTQQVYAGLTYGKGDLNEAYLNSDTLGKGGFTV